MNQKLNKILSFISRSFGFLFINMAMMLLFLAFFANLSLQQTDTLKQELQGYILKQSNITQAEFDQVKTFCEQNPAQENCEFFKQNPIEEVVNKISMAKDYFLGTFLLIIALLLLGFGLVFMATKNLIDAFIKISLNLSIQSFFAATYFNFLPDIFKAIINSSSFSQLAQGISQEEVNQTLTLMVNWLGVPMTRTFNLALSLGIVLTFLTIMLYFHKRSIKEGEIVDYNPRKQIEDRANKPKKEEPKTNIRTKK